MADGVAITAAAGKGGPGRRGFSSTISAPCADQAAAMENVPRGTFGRFSTHNILLVLLKKSQTQQKRADCYVYLTNWPENGGFA
jgi:hypothetical protein